MATTFTANGVVFLPLSTVAGRHALDPFVWSPTQSIKRFHCPGVDGNFTVIGGSSGGTINCRARYIGTEAGVYGGYETDVNGMIGGSFMVVSPGGTMYTRCKYVSSSITYGPRTMGNGTGDCFMDVTFAFQSDGGPSA